MKKFIQICQLLAAGGVLALSVTVGCSSSSTPGTTSTMPDAGGGTEPPAGDASVAPTFTNVYTTVFAVRCTGCHTTASGSGVTEGKLDMTSQAAAFTNLVGTAAAGAACSGKGTRITPGKPDDSIMYLKVSLDDPTPCGGKMPLGGPPLSQADADLIEAWINAGAKND